MKCSRILDSSEGNRALFKKLMHTETPGPEDDYHINNVTTNYSEEMLYEYMNHVSSFFTFNGPAIVTCISKPSFD